MLVKDTVRIHRQASVCKILTTLPANVLDEISDACSYEVEGAEHMKRMKYARYREWDGLKRLFHRSWKSFGSGLSERVSKILIKHGYDVKWDNDFQVPESFDFSFRDTSAFEERDYQTEAIAAAMDNQQGMIKIPTGGGKTYVAAEIMGMRGHNSVFLVHTKDLLYQAKEVFSKIFNVYGVNMVGQIGDGIIDPKTITVMTIQTASRALGVKFEKDPYSEDEDAWKDKETDYRSSAIRECIDGAGLVFMDECHRVAAPTATGVVSAFQNAIYRYGLSASPWRDDGADLALEAIFGHIIYDIKASTLIAQGHLVKPFIRFRQVPPQKFPKGTRYATIYEQYIVNNDARNSIVVNEAVRRISKGIPTLILVRRISHGGELQRRINEAVGGGIPFLSGQNDSDLRGSVIRDLRDGGIRGLVATTIADEGLDIKPLAALILAGGGKSSTRALQRVGRVLRPFQGKDHAEVIDFTDNAKFLIEHSMKRMEIYETEPDFSILDV